MSNYTQLVEENVRLEADNTQLLLALNSAAKLLAATLEWSWAENPAPFYGAIEAWMEKYTVAIKASYDGIDDSMQVSPERFK